MKRHFPNTILPRYRAAARFVYFNDLIESTQNISLNNHKIQLYNDVMTNLIDPASSIFNINEQNNNEVITSAIQFLKSVAANERRKEVLIVQQYLNQLQRDLPPNILNNKDFNDIYNKLQQFMNDPESVDLTDFYKDLTTCINAIRSNLTDYSNRLKQILNENRNNIRSDQYLFRVAGDIDGILRNIIDTKAREQENSFSAKTQKLLIQFAEQYAKNNLTAKTHFPAFLVALTIDFEHYLQTHLKENQTLDDVKDELEQLFEQYTTITDATSTNFLERMRQENQEAETILTDLEKGMGFEQIKPETEAWRQREKQLKVRERSRQRNNTIDNYLRKGFKNTKLYKEQLKYLTWTTSNPKNNRHGTIYEYVQSIISDQFTGKVSGSAAADVISIGGITGTINPQYRDLLYESVIQVREELENFAKQQHENRMTDLSKKYTEMNQHLERITQQLDSALKQLNIPDNLFIYHESLKLYQRIEEGKVSELHGRELNILTLLDQLYTFSGIVDGLTLLDRNTMYSLVLNLSSMAIGGGLKDSLENYFAIFAGMLMFDDAQNMAKELADSAVNQLNRESQVKNIHLYLINDIYIPGSMVLSFVADALEMGYQDISTRGNIAKVEIDTSKADSEISNYLQHKEGRYSIRDWPIEANAVSKGITARITFLTAFLKFLENLQENFSI